jgi:hypothetical protein
MPGELQEREQGQRDDLARTRPRVHGRCPRRVTLPTMVCAVMKAR